MSVGQADEAAFTDFVAARGRALWRSAWLLTGDAALAEDLLQTALARTWPHFARVEVRDHFEAYVRRSMLNTYLSWRSRKWSGEIPSAEAALTGSARTYPDEAESERRIDLARAMSALSPRQRAVVVLRYFEDLTEAQTAAALGCSIGSVKTHHARALAALRAGGHLDHEVAERETR